MPLIIHNISWSNYKAVVFTKLYNIGNENQMNYDFLHISEGNRERTDLTPIDYSNHKYPFTILQKGSREKTNKILLGFKSFKFK